MMPLESEARITFGEEPERWMSPMSGIGREPVRRLSLNVSCESGRLSVAVPEFRQRSRGG